MPITSLEVILGDGSEPPLLVLAAAAAALDGDDDDGDKLTIRTLPLFGKPDKDSQHTTPSSADMYVLFARHEKDKPSVLKFHIEMPVLRSYCTDSSHGDHEGCSSSDEKREYALALGAGSDRETVLSRHSIVIGHRCVNAKALLSTRKRTRRRWRRRRRGRLFMLYNALAGRFEEGEVRSSVPG